MIPLGEAVARVLRDCHPLAPVSVPVHEAIGLVTTEPVVATEAVPPFANSGMDGFAVVAADTVGASEDAPVLLTVVGTIAAGSAVDVEVTPGRAARIMTGAPIPPGADAVVMVERTRPEGDRVAIEAEVRTGTNVRHVGEDVQPGDVVVPEGSVITPGYLGMLAGHGHAEVSVIRRPRVGVFSTGDELVDGPRPLGRGQIRDSNRPTLLALVADVGCEAVDLGLVADDRDAIEAAIERGVASCDALVTSGGVSMGDFDYVKVVLDEMGDMDWMQVAIRPAKPLAFGTVNGVPVFGLPGNPVSSMVSFELFARAGLRQMMGHRSWGRQVVRAKAAEPMARRPDGKTHFARVRLSRDDHGNVVAASAGGQGSHQLAAMAAANGLAVVPDGEGVAEGGEVDVIVLGELSGPHPGWPDADGRIA